MQATHYGVRSPRKSLSNNTVHEKSKTLGIAANINFCLICTYHQIRSLSILLNLRMSSITP